MNKVLNILIFSIFFVSCKSSKVNENVSILDKNADELLKSIIDSKSDIFQIHLPIKKEYITKHKEYSVKEKKILKQSLFYYEKILKKFPKSEYYNQALLNSAYISKEIGKFKNASKYYEILVENDNPYLKEVANNKLMDIYIEKKQFNVALKFAKNYFKREVSYSCGNAKSEDEIYKASSLAEIYHGIGENKTALNYVLPEIFYNSLSINFKLVDLTIEILKDEYKQDLLINEFNKSLQKRYTIGKGEEKKYFIDYLNVKIEIPVKNNWKIKITENETENKVQISNWIIASKFYKELNKKNP